jgi:hypothetical protein
MCFVLPGDVNDRIAKERLLDLWKAMRVVAWKELASGVVFFVNFTRSKRYIRQRKHHQGRVNCFSEVMPGGKVLLG